MAENIELAPAVTNGRASRVSRRGVLIGAGGVAAGIAVGSLGATWRPATAQAAANDDDNAAIVKFHSMAPVTGAFVGAGGIPIRGIHGGGLPWALDAADGELSTDGRLRVRVRGLVLAAGTLIGTNPIPTFRAILSFENADPIFTDPVPASSTGNADVDTHIALPHPGFAPIIFVGPGMAPVWFSVTGNM